MGLFLKKLNLYFFFCFFLVGVEGWYDDNFLITQGGEGGGQWKWQHQQYQKPISQRRILGLVYYTANIPQLPFVRVFVCWNWIACSVRAFAASDCLKGEQTNWPSRSSSWLSYYTANSSRGISIQLTCRPGLWVDHAVRRKWISCGRALQTP